MPTVQNDGTVLVGLGMFSCSNGTQGTWSASRLLPLIKDDRTGSGYPSGQFNMCDARATAAIALLALIVRGRQLMSAAMTALELSDEIEDIDELNNIVEYGSNQACYIPKEATG